MTAVDFQPRIWTVNIQPPCEFISANHRRNRHANAVKVAAWRTAAWAAAKQAKLPTGLQRVRIDIAIQPPNRNLRDPDNLRPTCKAIVDGLGPPFVRMPSGRSKGAAAPGYGLMPDDNPKYVDGPYPEVIDPAPPRGAVAVTIVDLAGVAAGRTWTPDVRTATGVQFTVKRACNGCSRLLGDITHDEVAAAIHGMPAPDVTGECPFCSAVSGG